MRMLNRLPAPQFLRNQLLELFQNRVKRSAVAQVGHGECSCPGQG